MKKQKSAGMLTCCYDKCGKLFKPPKDNPNQEYCSEKCWRLSNCGEERKSK